MTEIWSSTLKWPPSGRSAPSQAARQSEKKVKKMWKEKKKQAKLTTLSIVACRMSAAFCLRNIEMLRSPSAGVPPAHSAIHSLLAPTQTGQPSAVANCSTANVKLYKKKLTKLTNNAQRDASNEILCFLMKIKVKHDLVNGDHLDLDAKCLLPFHGHCENQKWLY